METSSSSPSAVGARSAAHANYSSARKSGGHAKFVGIGRRPLNYAGRDGWASRIGYRTLYGGSFGAGTGLLMGSFKNSNALKWAGIMGTNSALVTLCFCGSQEIVREIRASDPDDLVNCIFGGLASGGLLGRIQGGPSRAVPCALLFAGVGTGLQFGINEFKEYRMKRFITPPSADLVPVKTVKAPEPKLEREFWKFPEWFPIQKLDEEAAERRKAEKEEEFRARVIRLHTGERP